MHMIIERDKTKSHFDQQREIGYDIQRIRDYFTTNYLLHSLAVQPEFVNVRFKDLEETVLSHVTYLI